MGTKKRLSRVKPPTSLGLGAHVVALSVLLVSGVFVAVSLLLSFTNSIDISPWDLTLGLMLIVGPIGFGSIWILGTAGIMGGTPAVIAVVEVAGALIGGIALAFIGPSESFINVAVGAGFGSFVSLIVVYPFFLIGLRQDRIVYVESPTESIARILSMNMDEDWYYGYHRAYYVTIRFSADGELINLMARVSGDIYDSLSVGSSIAIRYAPSDPAVALLEGEYNPLQVVQIGS